MKIINTLVVLIASLMASNAMASTILAPVDGNANFLVSQSFVETNHYQLAIFDDSATVTAAGVITTPGLDVKLDGPTHVFGYTYYAGIIGFTSFPPIYASNGNGETLNIGSTNHFMVGLGITDGSGATTWYADDGATPGAGNTVSLSFNTAKTGTFVVDVQIAPVPVPAAAWLFGTGLIGLVGVARRRRA
jgi:hypothetical protein